MTINAAALCIAKLQPAIALTQPDPTLPLAPARDRASGGCQPGPTILAFALFLQPSPTTCAVPSTSQLQGKNSGYALQRRIAFASG